MTEIEELQEKMYESKQKIENIQMEENRKTLEIVDKKLKEISDSELCVLRNYMDYLRFEIDSYDFLTDLSTLIWDEMESRNFSRFNYCVKVGEQVYNEIMEKKND